MRAPSATFQTTIAADQMPAVMLVELQLDTTTRYALHSTDVVFNSNTYTATSGSLGSIEQSLEGKAPRLSLTLQNVDRTIRDLLNTDDERGTVVVLRIVMTDDLSDSTALLEDTYELDAYGWDGLEARLELGSSPQIRGVQVPGRRTQTWFCPFAYKGKECGYVGSIATCDFTYQGKNGCTKHFGADAKRFGGFIGRPQAGLVVL